MGAVYGETCYVDAAAAAAAVCAATYPQTLYDATSGSVRSLECIGSTSASIEVRNTLSGAVTTQVVPVAFAGCDPGEHYADLSGLWLLGVLLLATLWSLRAAIVAPFFGNH